MSDKPLQESDYPVLRTIARYGLVTDPTAQLLWPGVNIVNKLAVLSANKYLNRHSAKTGDAFITSEQVLCSWTQWDTTC